MPPPLRNRRRRKKKKKKKKKKTPDRWLLLRRLDKTNNKSPYGNCVRAVTACHALRSRAGLQGFQNWS